MDVCSGCVWVAVLALTAVLCWTMSVLFWIEGPPLSPEDRRAANECAMLGIHCPTLATPSCSTLLLHALGAVALLVERRLPVWKVGSLKHSRAKHVTYKIDTCHYLAWRFALIGWDEDRLGRCEDNLTVCDIRGFGAGGLISQWDSTKFAMSAHCHKSVSVLI